MEKRPSDRFDTAGQMAAALEGLGKGAESDDEGKETRKKESRSPKETPSASRKITSRIEPRLIGGKAQIQNPCREGTMMWIVCQAAIERKTTADVCAELDRHTSGAGARLLDYKNDLRNEKKLDICIEGDRIVCYDELS